MSLKEFKNPLTHVWQYSNRTLMELKKRLTGYTEYSALLTQSGVDAPVAETLRNELGVTAEFLYTAPGVYTVIFSDGIFESPDEYVTISGTSTDGTDVFVIQAVPVFINALVIESYESGALTNAIIGNNIPCILTIRKYN